MLALCTYRSALATPTPSLCATEEQVAFSCPISGTHKTVSLCLGTATGGTLPARYVFGTIMHPELIYPSSVGGVATFRRTHLVYAGATGGNAYSFETADTRYILYSISGTGFDRAGVQVQRKGHLHASADLACRLDMAAYAMNGDLLDRTSAWGVDPEIANHNLPELPGATLS